MSEQVRESWGIVKKIAAAVGTLAVLFVAFYGVMGFVDSRIEQKITDDSYMKRLSDQLRPSVIFDSAGSVLVDSGGLTLIEPPIIEKLEHDRISGYVVTIKPKVFLSQAPLLQSLGVPYSITSERGDGTNWIFRLESHDFIAAARSPTPAPTETFRLEIIR